MKDENLPIHIKSPFVIIVFLVFAVPLQSWGQENIVTARPTLSVGPWTLPENSFQWEQGISYGNGAENIIFDGFFRAAISQSTEIRFAIANLEKNVAVFGAKWMMIKPENGKLGVGWSLSMGVYDNQFRVVGYRVAMNKLLAPNLVGFFNVGRAGDGFFGDLTLAYGMGERWTFIGEYWHHENWQQIQTGVTFLIDSETQVDINGGMLFNAQSDIILGIGFSRRFKMKYTRSDD
jgi:hypothetical protein